MAEQPHTPLDFKLAYGSVIALTVVFALGTLLLAYFPPPHDTGVMDTFTTVVKLGTGAIVGVMGGRAAA